MNSRLLIAAGALALTAAAGSASAQDWTGFYIGGHAGYGSLSQDDGETLIFDTNLDGQFGDTVRTAPPANADAFSPGFCSGTPNANNAAAGCSDEDDSGGDFGVRAGYDWQMGSWVFGVLGEYASVDVEDAATGFSTTPAAYGFTRQIDNVMAVRARLGYAMGATLPYVTAGFARADVDSTYATTNGANSFAPLTQSGEADGFQVGLGVEHRFTDRMTVGLEYVYSDLDADVHTVRTGQGIAGPTNPFLIVNTAGTDQRRSNDSIELHSIRLTAGFRF